MKTFLPFFIGFLILANVRVANAAVTANSLIKLECPSGAAVDHPCKAVYYYGSDGKRHAFPNDKVYFTWYSDFSTVQTVSSETMASFPLGTNVTYRPGVKLVKITTNPKVYAVAEGSTLRWVTSEALANSIYGTNWNTQVDDIPDTFLINYSIGADIKNASDFSPTAQTTTARNINVDKKLVSETPTPTPSQAVIPWTFFSEGADTKKIYVSSLQGKDSNDCLSPQSPCQTIAQGVARLRDGFPDWLLLKKGDLWINENFEDWRLSGRSASEPMLISSYGSGARPLLKTGKAGGFVVRAYDRAISNIAIVGLHFKAHTRDPRSNEYQGSAGAAGIDWLAQAIQDDQGKIQSMGQSANILLEDNKIEYYVSAAIFQTDYVASKIKNVRIVGNVLIDSWAVEEREGYSQGIYTENVDTLLVEGNLIDHNGGLFTFPSDPYGIVPPGLSKKQVTVIWFNHAAYINTNTDNVTFRNNIIARGDGVQLRGGGVAEGNLFYKTAVGLSLGVASFPRAGGVTGRLVENTFLAGTDFPPESATPGERGFGILIENIAPAGAVVRDNLFVRDISAKSNGNAFRLHAGPCENADTESCLMENVVIEDNLVYEWRGGVSVARGSPGSDLKKITIRNNLIQNPSDTQATLVSHNVLGPQAFTYAGNTYFRGGNSDWFADEINGRYNSSIWQSRSGETGAQVKSVTFPDANRTLESYHATLGGIATGEAFFTQVRQLSKDNWPSVYTAQAVNQYMRAGFGR